MGRKQTSILCDSCESPLRVDSSFCPACGRPTRWATHDERVAWEVRQWRASRARDGGTTTTMMLVRTEAGYEPSPMRPGDQYVWDQPLHPERHDKPAAQRPTPQRPTGNGNGNGRGPATRDAEPADAAPEDVARDVVPESPGPVEPAATASPDHRDEFAAVMVADLVDERGRDIGIGISKKAVAVGLLLAVGLPLSGKAVTLARGGSSRAKAPTTQAATAGTIRPLDLLASRSGFSQVTPDAARYAIVLRNPNRGFTVYGVGVSVSLYDRSGRLIGTAVERIGWVPSGGSIAVAGQAGVSGQVARLKAQMSVAGFEPARSKSGFFVRGVRMVRSGGGVTVRASVSGVIPAHNARLVMVYVDRSGRIVGGDFTYLDVPSSPRSASAVVTTSGVGRSVYRVEAYVVTSQ
jgi:hypothetical protein